MKQIDISTPKHPNTFAQVDDADYEWLNQWKWGAVLIGNTCYAVRQQPRNTTILMHRFILGEQDNNDTIDHANHNGLDNQRTNLRACTKSQNGMNRGKTKTNTSGFKGVSWDKNRNKWLAKINTNGKTTNLGRFNCLIKAAKAYNDAAIMYHGAFAGLNTF